MAGLGSQSEPLSASGGPLGPLARAQYGALLRLRGRIFVNSLRTASGAFEFGARTLSYLVYAAMGLGLGFGIGAGTYALVSDEQWQYLPILFWVLLLLWQVVPIMLASFQEQFNLGTLLRFPLSFGTYYALFVFFGFSDVSTVIGALCSLGIFIGVVLARPELAGWAALALGVFAAFNILLVRAVFAWIDRWLSQRRTREILAGLFLLFFLAIQVMNPAVWQGPRKGSHRQQREEIRQVMNSPQMRTAVAVQAWLPPGLAAAALREAAEDGPMQALGSLAMLGGFVLAAGAVLGFRLRGEYRGENLGEAPARGKPTAVQAKTERGTAWSATVTGPAGEANPLGAIIAKDFRSLFRTLPLLYAIGAPLLMVLVLSGSFLRGHARTPVPILVFPLCVFFAQIAFHQLFGNSLGAEGAGIQLYFLSPTPIRTVLLGKNLLHAALWSVSLVIAGFLATMRLGPPPPMLLADTAAWLLFVLPCNMAWGNVFSLMMPYRIHPGRLSRQGRSQASVFLSLFLEAALLGVGVLVYQLGVVAGIAWLPIPVFLALAGTAAVVWLRILAFAGQTAENRRDQLIATLMKTE